MQIFLLNRVNFFLLISLHTWQLIVTQECNRTIEVTNSSNTLLESPNWPRPYEANTSCTWIINGSIGTVVHFAFRNFSLEDSVDYLTIVSGDVTKKFTGDPCTPFGYPSSHHSAVVTFVSDYSTQNSGFTIQLRSFAVYRAPTPSTPTYKYPPPSLGAPLADCGGSLNATSNTSILNFYFTDGYAPNQNCTWTINSESNRKINIDFRTFRTETCCDYLMVLDGDVPVKVFQGLQCPRTYVSSNSNLTLIFRSDEDFSEGGFQAIYSAASDINLTQLNTDRELAMQAKLRLVESQPICRRVNGQFNETGDLERALAGERIQTFWMIQPKKVSKKQIGEVAKTNEDMCNSTSALEALMSIIENTNIEITEKTLRKVVETISEISGISGSLSQPQADGGSATSPETPFGGTRPDREKTTLLMTLLSKYAERTIAGSFRLSLPGGNQTGLLVNISTPLISLQMKRIRMNSSYPNGYPDETFYLSDGYSNDTVTAEINSETVLKIAKRSGEPNPIVIAYTFKESSNYTKNLKRISKIFTILSPGVNPKGLSVTFKYGNEAKPNSPLPTDNPKKRKLQEVKVRTWDYSASKWVMAPQCREIDTRPLTYHCDNFASYAALFSGRIVQSIVVLDIVSKVGLSLSIAFLLATIAIYLIIRELRMKPSTPAILNICVCLVAFYLIFAVGVGEVVHKKTCDGLAFILHYTSLTCMLWMSFNAYQMFRAFSMLQKYDQTIRWFHYLALYGLPFLLVFINFATTVLYLDSLKYDEGIFFESLYRSGHMCWLQAPSFNWGYLLPLSIMLVFNYVMFAIVLKKAVFRKRTIRSTASAQTMKDRLLNSIAMVTLMGLTWVFGYFLLVSVDIIYEEIMQWLFTVCNVFQGVVIFYLYCLRRENVRKHWLPSWKKSNDNSSFMLATNKNSTSERSATRTT